MTSDSAEILERLLDKEDWKNARISIKRLLRKSPEDHWLLTRLSTTYYEERKYLKALEISEKALKYAPRCWLVLWDYACDLDMVGRERDAIRIYKRLLRRGPVSIANGECGEGLRRAESLLLDCLYRIGCAYADIGQRQLARRYLQRHLTSRRKGLESLYERRVVLKKLRSL